jgi:acetyl-CoA synthetase
VGKFHEIKGESLFAFVVCKNGFFPAKENLENLKEELCTWVATQIGAIAKPDDIRFVEGLPKTRSGKIMRRILRNVANGHQITQDISTLENPAIIELLKTDI